MSNAIKTYEEIISDLNLPKNSECTHLNRSILLPNKIRIVYIVIASSKQRIIAVELPHKYNASFPKWKGITFQTGKISAYDSSSNNEYVIISQAKDFDSNIFEVVVNDISAQLEKIPGSAQVIGCLNSTLNKWKKFFSLTSEIILFEQLQMGLYGELTVLKKLISEYGSESVAYWSGAEKETHDFYINGNAVEVKTTASKSSEKVKISNEFQLSTNDIKNQLFLYVCMVRRSNADGETLPMVIDEIRNMLDGEIKELFEYKLFMYGYVDSCRDKYTTGFFMRSKLIYMIVDGFPNLTPDDLELGISEVSYSLDLNVCADFQIEWNDVINKISNGVTE